MKIHFLGAAGTVTGSKYLVETGDLTILIDCGLFQGLKELRALNWSNLAFSAAKIDLVLITHGHLDHVGYLPRLVKEGFSGRIFGTTPTLEITKLILDDSARIQEEDADRANEQGFSKHYPALPLYDSEDVKKTIPLFFPQPLDEWIELGKGIACRFRYNGHIIGATFIELMVNGKLIVFSGDIGKEQDLLLYPPQQPERADILLVESTYGNRLQPHDAEARLELVIKTAAAKGGTILIPSFAVERSQLLMYLLWQLKKKKLIPDLPVYMDSPMGTGVLGIFEHNPSWHKLPVEDCREMCRDIRLIKNIKDTYELAASTTPKIIIAASGMATGGRILTYFVQYLGKANATILLAGFQAEGTRGRALLEGAKEIKLYGKMFPVKASVESIEGLSAHADQSGLIGWLSHIKKRPELVFIVHGEKDASLALKNKIKEIYGWNAVLPELNQVFELSDSNA